MALYAAKNAEAQFANFNIKTLHTLEYIQRLNSIGLKV